MSPKFLLPPGNVQARGFLEPSELLKGEPQETLPSVKKALRVLNNFSHAFTEHKEKLHTYFTDSSLARPWDFPHEMVFTRFDKFVGLVETVVVSGGCKWCGSVFRVWLTMQRDG